VSARHFTWHLTPAAYWRKADRDEPYRPEAFEEDGFIHCTDGEERAAEVGNRYYRDDTRPYVALLIDLGRLTSPWRYADDEHVYPHIYGPLNRDAIVGAYPMPCSKDGTFAPPRH
jgi:uncharacterized protein (DUF952 family)